MLKGRRLRWIGAIGVAIAMTAAGAPALGATGPGGFSLRPTYRAGDYARGQAMNILPPGENGLVNAAQLAKFEKNGQRPPHSQDQLAPYENLEFSYRSLTDATLHNYYLDESFGVKPGQVIRTEHPSPHVPVVIYRDEHDIPHIYGKTNPALAFGAGYAQAQDRLFLMDVLRHYGAGTLSSFLGPSCADEQMDHDELLLAPYTTAQANAQINNLPKQHGAQGKLALAMIRSYVRGINAYIGRALTDPKLLPAEYTLFGPPKPWTPADVVAVSSLIGGIFGDGGGEEVRNAALLRYLQGQLGRSGGATAFTDFKEQNDPAAPTTVVGKSFPYEIPRHVNPATVAIPDNPSAPSTTRIRIKALEAGWGRNPTIKNLDLTLTPGTKLAITGRSGAGKSTLGMVLARFLDPTAGTITINDRDIRDIPEEEIRRTVVLIGDDTDHIFAATLRENLRLAKPAATDDELRRVLRRVRLPEWTDRLDTWLGTGGTTVSGGQARRLATARALLADPGLLILDEPTEGLDEPTARALMTDLLDAADGRIVLVLTHRTEGLEKIETRTLS